MLKESEKLVESNILEGIVSIKALISAREMNINDRAIHTVLFDESKINSKPYELRYLKSKAKVHKFNIEFVNSDKIASMTIGSSHGGIIALCGDRTFAKPDKPKPNGFYVMLEGVEDPYNFGQALRTLYAAGVDGIVLTPRNWMGVAGVVCRASAGASELFPMFISECADAVEYFKANGYQIVCADKNNAVSIFKTTLLYPIFLILGGEKRGISRTILDKADVTVNLDYGRDFNASLSTSSAASILAYEIFRQNIDV